MFSFFISELLAGHWEESRDAALHRPCLFLVYFTLCRNIYSSHCKTPGQNVCAAPTKPGGGVGAEGGLWVPAERGRLPLEPPGCKTSGAWVRLPVDTGATAPKLVWTRPRGTGDFTVSLKCGFRQTLWFLSVFIPLTTATSKTKDLSVLFFFILLFCVRAITMCCLLILCCDAAAAPGEGLSKTWLSQGLQDRGNLFPLLGCAGLQPSALRLLCGADVARPPGQEEPLEKNWGALF